MDAHDCRDECCQQHLHGDGHPTDKKPYSNPPGDRPPIKVPDHGLGNSITHPTPEGIRCVFCTANLVVQLATKRRRIRQMVFQPVTAHDQCINKKKRETPYNNVVAAFLLNFSQRIIECYPESVGRR